MVEWVEAQLIDGRTWRLVAVLAGIRAIEFDPLRAPEGQPNSENGLLREAVRQLAAYLQGELRKFQLPLDFQGTDFQKRVWRQLETIPYGETRSYMQIAEAIGRPQAVRAVGAANGANPIPIVVPCHRVIGASGKLVGYGGGLALKKRLLELEGVVVSQPRLAGIPLA
ncbi:MAG: methylated-DNA--[protein]-cysteine S-methyltransferase [Acidobacteriia bacterium]|nr:methylated-DNA--[protein]-cysteine S-methyltransferase [Terriglobia bacterium]